MEWVKIVLAKKPLERNGVLAVFENKSYLILIVSVQTQLCKT